MRRRAGTRRPGHHGVRARTSGRSGPCLSALGSGTRVVRCAECIVGAPRGAGAPARRAPRRDMSPCCVLSVRARRMVHVTFVLFSFVSGTWDTRGSRESRSLNARSYITRGPPIKREGKFLPPERDARMRWTLWPPGRRTPWRSDRTPRRFSPLRSDFSSLHTIMMTRARRRSGALRLAARQQAVPAPQPLQRSHRVAHFAFCFAFCWAPPFAAAAAALSGVRLSRT